jgi:hypothetical protein
MNYYIKLILLVTCIYAQASISSLETLARQIPDSPCSSQIIMTLNEAQVVFQNKGLSPEFIQALEDVKTVSGDKKVVESFRSLLSSSINDFTIQENIIAVNTSVLKTGPGLPEGFGKSSDASSTRILSALIACTLLHLFKLF